MKRIALLFALSALTSAASAGSVPRKLSGVIVFDCVTMDAGMKVDEEIYKIDFTKRRVNDRPVEFDITELSVGWEYLPKRTDGHLDTAGEDGASINRFSGRLDYDVHWSDSKRVTICHVAGPRIF